MKQIYKAGKREFRSELNELNEQIAFWEGYANGTVLLAPKETDLIVGSELAKGRDKHPFDQDAILNKQLR